MKKEEAKTMGISLEDIEAMASLNFSTEKEEEYEEHEGKETMRLITPEDYGRVIKSYIVVILSSAADKYFVTKALSGIAANNGKMPEEYGELEFEEDGVMENAADHAIEMDEEYRRIIKEETRRFGITIDRDAVEFIARKLYDDMDHDAINTMWEWMSAVSTVKLLHAAGVMDKDNAEALKEDINEDTLIGMTDEEGEDIMNMVCSLYFAYVNEKEHFKKKSHGKEKN